MSEHEESLASELAPSGSLAWQRLHGDVSSQLMVDVAAANGCRWRWRAGSRPHPDAAERRAAYEGELAAWETVACRSPPRSTAPRARSACSTGAAASPTTSNPRCAPTTSTARRSTR